MAGLLRKTALTAATILTSTLANAQWTSYPSFSECELAASVGNAPIVATKTSACYYTESDGVLSILDKSNGKLNAVNITAIAGNDHQLFVGYDGGEIDIVDLRNGTTTFVPELSKSSAYQMKRINAMCVHGNKLYCGFACGIVEVDITKEEIRSIWRIVKSSGGIDVKGVQVDGNSIYAMTSQGIYKGDLRNPVLENSALWELLPKPQENLIGIATIGGQLVAATGETGGNGTLWRVIGDDIDSIGSASRFRNITTSDDKLYVVEDQKLTTYGNDLKKESETTNFFWTNSSTALKPGTMALRSGCATTDGRIALADHTGGMLLVDSKGYGQIKKPKGPATNTFSSIACTGNDVYLTGPGRNSSYSFSGVPTTLLTLKNNEWTYASTSYRDPCFIAIDPNDNNNIYVSTWGDGVYKVEGTQFGQHYALGNSTMTDVFGGSTSHTGFLLYDAIAFDDEHNLYIASGCNNGNSLCVRTSDGEWHAYKYSPMAGSHSNSGMIITSNGNGWAWGTRKGQSLTIFNTNGTIEDDSDDLYWALEDSHDKQCMGTFTLTDASSGETLTTQVNSIAEDHNGIIWVGTNNGLLVCDNDADLFYTQDAPEFNRVRVPRNDGTNLADYLLDGSDIRCIAVDGANRKWISTADNGVYLVSENGYENIHHFTSSNSPLYSNIVQWVGIRPHDGEVFFINNYGLQSFDGDASEPAATLDQVNIYPNPVSMRSTRDYVTITGLEENSHICVTDVAGNRVFYAKSHGGMARWDLKRPDGARAATGIYIVWAANSDGSNKAVGKILVTK